MKPTLKVATHLGAAAIGVALAATTLPLISSSTAASAEKSRSSRQSAGDSARPGEKQGKRARPTASESRSAAYRAAWAALAKEPLNTADRFAAQTRLLAEWAKYDLDGALQAFLGEAWDNRDPSRPFANEPLGDAFATIFKEQPLDTWRAINRDPMLRNRLSWIWMHSVTQKEPGLVAAMLGELPAQVQSEAVAELFSRNPSLTPEKREELLKKLTTSGTPAEVEKWLAQVYRDNRVPGDPAALAAKWNAMPAGGPRTIQMTAWASALHGADIAKFTAEWEKVPAEDRGQAARMLLAQVSNQSPALTQAIELAVETGQWDALKDGVADKLRGFQTDRQALAEWALKLPAREETRAIFNLSISEILLNDPAAGRAWLEELPAGSWHREWGFVEMTLGRLWARGDIEGANRAIEAITDPRAREEALKCRYDWQLITSQPQILREE
jgi:hypothetical protein